MTEIKSGDIAEVDWDGTEVCFRRNSNTRVVFIGNQNCRKGRSCIAYVDVDGRIIRGYVNTSNLRPVE